MSGDLPIDMRNTVTCRFISASIAIELRLRTAISSLRASQIAAQLGRELDAAGIRNGGVTHIVHTENETSLYLTVDVKDLRQMEANMHRAQELVEALLRLPPERQ